MKKPCFVYFISEKRRKSVKIGISTNPEARLRELQNGSPVKLEIIGAVPGGRRDEEAIHCGFSALWSHGEWFNFGNEIWDFMEDCLCFGNATEAIEQWGFKPVQYENQQGRLTKYEWLAEQSELTVQ